MKGIAGIISAIVLIIILITAISVMMYVMNVVYEQQQTVENYVNNFISSPKAFQINATALVSNGPLEVKYAIYPNGTVDSLSIQFDGKVNLANLLYNNSWVYVVLSNGQTFNITSP